MITFNTNSEIANSLKRDEIDELKRHNKIEEETKDRVDISKKEYLKLIEDKKHFEKTAESYKKIINKIVKPLIKNHVDEKIIEKIINNEFDINVTEYEDPTDLVKKIAVVYEIRREDLC